MSRGVFFIIDDTRHARTENAQVVLKVAAGLVSTYFDVIPVGYH